MEVILKKTKITSAILKQTLKSTSIDLSVGEVLGWCLYNKLKYIICYRIDLTSLSIFPFYKELTTEERTKERHGTEEFIVKIHLGGNYVPIQYSDKTKEGHEKFIEILKIAKHKAETKGQFFI